jgi:hypothetical protein
MISYFKYTDGSTLTLDGAAYKGMFNYFKNAFYVDSLPTAPFRRLESTNNFFAEVYRNKYDFNFTSYTQLTVLRNTAKAYSRTILTYAQLDTILNELNKNNVFLYSKLISFDNDLFNVYAGTYDNIPTTYCLTGADDTFSSKQLPLVRLGLATDHPLYKARPKGRRTSLFISHSAKDIFTYFSNGVQLKGSIKTQNTSLSSADSSHITDGIPYYNRYTSVIYYVFDTKFSMYFFDPTSECDITTRIDTFDISLKNGVVSNTTVTFGLNYRCAIVSNNNEEALEISEVNKSQQIFSVTVKEMNIDTVISTCQRFEDDIYAILYIKDGEVRLRVYDLQQLLAGFPTFSAFAEKATIVNQKIIYDNRVDGGIGLNHTIEFAPFDSDIVLFRLYRYQTLAELQFRSISNPRFPLAVFDGYSRTGNIGLYAPFLNNLTTPFDVIKTSFDKLGAGDPFPIYDIAFDVQDTIRYFIFYQDSIEVSHIDSIYSSALPLNLVKQYRGSNIASGDSIGLIINNALRYIVYDTLNIYKMCTGTIERNKSTGSYIGMLPVLLPKITDYDLYLYENESINIGVFDRICDTLQEIQQNIARAITQVV